jgi:hypothetical protein
MKKVVLLGCCVVLQGASMGLLDTGFFSLFEKTTSSRSTQGFFVATIRRERLAVAVEKLCCLRYVKVG